MDDAVLDARRIPVFATFIGVTFMPWWYALANNSLYQRFAVGKNGIETRVLRVRRYAWDEIAAVEVRHSGRGALLTVRFPGRVLTFAARLSSAAATEALAAFPAATPRTVISGTGTGR